MYISLGAVHSTAVDTLFVVGAVSASRNCKGVLLSFTSMNSRRKQQVEQTAVFSPKNRSTPTHFQNLANF
jgi:hypothetical protein